MTVKHSFIRNVIIAGVVSAGLAACIETAGNERIAVDDRVSAAKARSATTAKVAAKSSVGAPAKAAAASAKMSVPDQARAQLKRQCMAEHSGPFRTDSATASECDCFAGTVVNSLRPDDLDFYIAYEVVPTLSGTRPEDVKMKCGIAVLDRSGSRGSLAAPGPS